MRPRALLNSSGWSATSSRAACLRPAWRPLMNSPPELPPGPTEGASGGIQAGRYYGRSIPYLPIDAYPGKLIAIEGTDGVGRSTQIQLLREWLEVRGYGVGETGWARPAVIAPTNGIAETGKPPHQPALPLLFP